MGRIQTSFAMKSGIRTWFRQLFSTLPELKWPSTVLLISLVVGLALGFYMASQYKLPASANAGLSGGQIASNTAEMQLLYSELPMTIFMQNVRVIILIAFLGIITLGVTDVLFFMLPWVLVGFLGGQIGAAGAHPISSHRAHRKLQRHVASGRGATFRKYPAHLGPA